VIERTPARAIRRCVLDRQCPAVPWDLRPILHGLGGLVGAFVLSFEEGAVMPDPAIFRTACRRLRVTPEATLMVGDSEETDGGAVSAGLQVMILPPAWLPARRGLEGVLKRLRIA